MPLDLTSLAHIYFLNVHSTLFIKLSSPNQGKMFVNTTMAYLVVGVASEASVGGVGERSERRGGPASEAEEESYQWGLKRGCSLKRPQWPRMVDS